MIQLPASAAPSPSSKLLEQAVYDASPLGGFGTSLAIFLVLFGSFEAIALATHYPLADQLSLNPKEGAWPALILSLVAAVALGMQRYVRMKDAEEMPSIARLMPCDPANLAIDTSAARRRIRRAGWLGAVLGLAAAFLSVPPGVLQQHPAVFAWFAVVMVVLGAMFARGTAITRIASKSFADRIDRDLKIDLLRVDELALIGRTSSRAALVWLSVAAVVCLFFVGGNALVLTIVTVALSAGMAFWVYFRSLERVHRHIRIAKRAELERLRHAIAQASAQAAHDHVAAARLHGLLAYETRIERVHEWPFDQLTALRVGAYVLIPATPALGQMAMRFFMHAAL
jgi:drug/metabolite transporter (DMT)-like permease